jgi:hypothetical protein
LKKQGIDIVFRTNEAGRIYGITFIDHRNRVVMNGSRWGKEFSANVFNDLFNGEKKHKTEIKPEIVDTLHAVSENGSKSDTSLMEEAFGLLGALLHGDDYEETVFARKMRKKKTKT